VDEDDGTVQQQGEEQDMSAILLHRLGAYSKQLFPLTLGTALLEEEDSRGGPERNNVSSWYVHGKVKGVSALS